VTFPIVRRPRPGHELPVLVTVPHYGTRALPGVSQRAYARAEHLSLPRGFADAFAADLYGDLHASGATVLASPYSRLFVDLNRRRDDFEEHDGGIRSRRGVVRTHMVCDEPIFAEGLSGSQVEERLERYYDPFYGKLRMLLDDLHARHGRVLVLDGHTAIARRIEPHQIVIGTRGRSTCDARIAMAAEKVFRAHGFEPRHDVPGYIGGNIVRTTAVPGAHGVHAIQVEVNAALLMPGTRRDYVVRVRRGERPAPDPEALASLRACLSHLLRRLARSLLSLR
jgi:N-formylglutamate deformylase